MTIAVVLTVPDWTTQNKEAFDAARQNLAREMPVWTEEVNQTQEEINQQASDATDAATAAAGWADAAQQHAQAADASAELAAIAASANAQTWVADADYEANQVVWGDANTGLQFRCIAPHSGISTPPVNDPAHWVRVGPGGVAPDPTVGPSAFAVVYDSAQRPTSATFTQDGIDGTIGLVWGGNGSLIRAITTWAGRTSTEFLIYNDDGTFKRSYTEIT